MQPEFSLQSLAIPSVKKTNPVHQLVSQMPETQQLVLRAATRKLFDSRHFSICTVDSMMKLIGATERSPAYTQLSALHCVDYADMPQDLRERLPLLVRECLSCQTADQAADIVLGQVIPR